MITITNTRAWDVVRFMPFPPVSGMFTGVLKKVPDATARAWELTTGVTCQVPGIDRLDIPCIPAGDHNDVLVRGDKPVRHILNGAICVI